MDLTVADMADKLIVSVIVLVSIVLPIWMIKILIELRKTGPRSGSFTSGVAGMMSEIDKVIRPSNEHVIEADEEAKSHQDAIGGE